MLILEREYNERICIGEGIEICIVAIKPGRVKIGIECSKEIPVDRKEVRLAKRAEQEARREKLLGGET